MEKDKNIILVKIDKLNKESWENKYLDIENSLNKAEKALKLSEEIAYNKGVVISNINISIIKFLLSKDDGQILMNLLKSIDVLEMQAIPCENYVRALYFAGNIYESYGDFDNALAYSQKGLKIAEKINYQQGIADASSVIGLIYSRLGEYNNSIKFHKKAMKLRQKIDDKKALASSFNLIARTNVLKNNFAGALTFYNKALDLRKKINDLGGLPYTYLGIASLHESKKDLPKAIEFYNKALECNKTDDIRLKMHCFMGLGRIQTDLEIYEQAEINLKNALEIAQTLMAKPILYAIHLALSEFYEKITKIDVALLHFKLFQKNKEEVLSDELRNKLKNQQITWTIEKSKKEAEIHHLKHVQLKTAYDKLSEKNKEITDSINYARRIQTAVLPRKAFAQKLLPDHFILFKPKDIVSGDFYWLTKVDKKIIVAAADCTGHGVPGGFMSMLGISFLNKIVSEKSIVKSNEILDTLRENIIKALQQTTDIEGSKDGMDIALSIIDYETNTLYFSGANNPLYLIRNNELTAYRGDKMPIAIYPKIKPFEHHEIKIQKNDAIYMFSDGYADQFGGQKSRKFMTKRFKNLLLHIYNEKMNEQKTILNQKIEKWMSYPDTSNNKNNHEQIDDILVIGVRI